MSITELSEEEFELLMCDERKIAHEKGLEKGMEKGMEMGIELGEEAGERKSKIQIINNMLKLNYSIPQICNVKGESADFVNSVLEGVVF
ncbi:MAG: hypothetical protein E7265_08455 [Lachnospiraceae bacterium]|nr:hypothetical protein [Lachnospiraceae bacterium]